MSAATPNKKIRRLSASSAAAPSSVTTLKGPHAASLLAHDASFVSLLSLLPANLYLGPDEDEIEEADNKYMKNKRKKDKENESKERKDKARENKRAKLDPANQKSIPELQAERATRTANAAVNFTGSGLEDSDDSDASVDSGDEEAASGSEHAGDTDNDLVDSDDEAQLPAQASKSGASTITDLRARLHARIGVLQAKRRAPGITGSNQLPLGVRAGAAAAESGEEEEEEEEGDAGLAGSKDELLEQRRKKRGEMRDRRRKERKEQRRAEASSSATAPAKGSARAEKGQGASTATTKAPALFVSDRRSDHAASSARPTTTVQDSSDLSFSALKFSASSSDPSAKRSKHELPSDPKAALAMLEARKARDAKRLEKRAERDGEATALEGDKERKERERWSRAEAAAEGVKIRDDETRLKKAVKKIDEKKKKSGKEWNDRARDLEKKQAERIKKRTDNLAARKDRTSKKGGKKGGASGGGKKGAKARPGFEGKASAFGGGRGGKAGGSGRGGASGGRGRGRGK